MELCKRVAEPRELSINLCNTHSTHSSMVTSSTTTSSHMPPRPLRRSLSVQDRTTSPRLRSLSNTKENRRKSSVIPNDPNM